jgi:hypothetical protein
MEARDRIANLALLVAAGAAWLLVAVVVTTTDPIVDPSTGTVGAGAIGLALGLSTVPLFWLLGFARHGRVAYRGDWVRAVRRGAWVGAVAGVLVLLRVEGFFQLPIALFLIAMAIVAESTLSADR